MSQVLDIPKENVRFVETALKVSGDTIEFSFMSREPVSRPFGNEILDPKGCDFTRMNSGAVQWLWNHDSDSVLGVVQRGWLVGSDKGMCRVRFGAGPTVEQYGENIRNGTISNVSFKYSVDEFKLLPNGDVLVTQFTPLEVSSVSIPADATVGIGRSFYSQKGDLVMPTAARRIAETERIRVQSIEALGRTYEGKFGNRSLDLANELIESETPIEGARSAFLELISERQTPIAAPLGEVGLYGREQRDYSVAKAILFSGGLISERECGLEVECHKTLARSLGRQTKGFLIPLDGMRGYQAAAPTTGGNLVATDLGAASFIELLRNKALCMQMGIIELSGLIGNTAIPRQTAGSTAYWVGEDVGITESAGAFDQVVVAPKQLGALSKFSRLMLQQSTPGIESIVRNDFVQVLAIALDSAMLNGTGGVQPRGILQTAGISSVALGANGGVPTFAMLTEMLRTLRASNADTGSLGWMINPNVAKKFQSTLKNPAATDAGFILGGESEDSILGIKVATTNQIPSNLTKGSGTNLSAILLGNWSDLIVANWGVLEIDTNPYIETDFAAGRVAVRAMMSVDVAVRQPKSFVACTDVVTT